MGFTSRKVLPKAPSQVDPFATQMHSMKKNRIRQLLEIMAKLRQPHGCPWDRQQTHHSIRFSAVEEAYEMVDAIEAGDDEELLEELGDLLLQVVFHAQMASERGAFNFDQVAERIVQKLIRRHPHVFGDRKIRTVEGVWSQWEEIKQAEKKGTKRERPSVLDGIPSHLPALLQAEKLVKKARKAGFSLDDAPSSNRRLTRKTLGRELFRLAQLAQKKGWSAEDLLRQEIAARKRGLLKTEKRRPSSAHQKVQAANPES
jgi:uncharacterized protein YabN with tetrapyrrole methylase and pyrophosphatase domain